MVICARSVALICGMSIIDRHPHTPGQHHAVRCLVVQHVHRQAHVPARELPALRGHGAHDVHAQQAMVLRVHVHQRRVHLLRGLLAQVGGDDVRATALHRLRADVARPLHGLGDLLSSSSTEAKVGHTTAMLMSEPMGDSSDACTIHSSSPRST